jgi:hypothetical protein
VCRMDLQDQKVMINHTGGAWLLSVFVGLYNISIHSGYALYILYVDLPLHFICFSWRLTLFWFLYVEGIASSKLSISF